MAVQSDIVDGAGPYDRAKALSAFKLGDVTFYWITRLSAISVLLILGGIIVSLIIGAWPAMQEYGLAFLWTQRWAPSADPPFALTCFGRSRTQAAQDQRPVMS